MHSKEKTGTHNLEAQEPGIRSAQEIGEEENGQPKHKGKKQALFGGITVGTSEKLARKQPRT